MWRRTTRNGETSLIAWKLFYTRLCLIDNSHGIVLRIASGFSPARALDTTVTRRQQSAPWDRKVLRRYLFGPIDLRRTSSWVPESSCSQHQLLKVLLFVWKYYYVWIPWKVVDTVDTINKKALGACTVEVGNDVVFPTWSNFLLWMLTKGLDEKQSFEKAGPPSNPWMSSFRTQAPTF